MTFGKTQQTRSPVVSCSFLYDTRNHIHTQEDHVDLNIDRCVQDYCEKHTVCGRGLNDLQVSDVDVFKGVLGRGIGTCSETMVLHKKLVNERAWYDVIQTDQVLRHANVQPDPDRNDCFLQTIMWS